MAQLREELARLGAGRIQAAARRDNNTGRSHRLSLCNGRLALLQARLASARLVEPPRPAPPDARFGATVRLCTVGGGQVGSTRKFTIVGVDEVDVAADKVAFILPLARVVQGARSDQPVMLRLGAQEETVEVVEVSYEAAD